MKKEKGKKSQLLNVSLFLGDNAIVGANNL